MPEDVLHYVPVRIAPVERELLSTAEAAHALGVGKTRLYELINSNQLKSLKLGRSRRIPRTEVERFIAVQMQPQKVG